jgi:hypothetical protein
MTPTEPAPAEPPADRGGVRRHADLRRLVPLTPLRHFYDLLRAFPSAAFHREAARECARRPDGLRDLVVRSRRHAELYDNRAEDFRPPARGMTPERQRSPRLADRLLRMIRDGRAAVPRHPGLEFEFVDYEVNPLRTTRSECEDGSSAERMGGGGVDVLLAARDRLPAVGEIKVARDSTPFLALVQALTYAVELSTPAQQARLDRTYPGRFARPGTGPAVDVYLLLADHPADQAEFVELTGRVVDGLMRPGTPAADVIRRVVCLKAVVGEAARASFDLAFARPDLATVSPPTP